MILKKVNRYFFNPEYNIFFFFELDIQKKIYYIHNCNSEKVMEMRYVTYFVYVYKIFIIILMGIIINFLYNEATSSINTSVGPRDHSAVEYLLKDGMYITHPGWLPEIKMNRNKKEMKEDEKSSSFYFWNTETNTECSADDLKNPDMPCIVKLGKP